MESLTAHRDNETRCRRGTGNTRRTACNLLFIGTWKRSGAAVLEIRSASKFKTIRRQRCRRQPQRPATGCRVHAYKKKDTGATQDAPGSPHSPARAAGVEEHHREAQNAHSRHRRRRAGTGAGANLFDTGRRGYSQGRLYAPVLYYY